MSSGITDASARASRYPFVLGVLLGVYTLFGLYTHLIFVRTQPDFDFYFYEDALAKARAGADPYDIRDIGPAFLYPPPSLFVIEAFQVSADPQVRSLLFVVVSVGIMLFIIRQICRRFGYSARKVWFWYPLVLFFAPFLATLQAGQVNLITGLGIVLFFTSALPWLAALGLVLAIITKVTPIAFLFYSLVRRDARTIFFSFLFLAVIALAGGFRFGFDTYGTYFDVFRGLLRVFGLTQNSQSFEAKVWMVFQPQISPAILHTSFLVYLGSLVLASGFLAIQTQDFVPLFIVLALAVAVSPNVIWYHHYVFLLPPLLVWMAWQKLERKQILWVMTGLLIVQMDYYLLTTGLVIHLFVQLSILRVLFQQYSKLRMTEPSRRISVV